MNTINFDQILEDRKELFKQRIANIDRIKGSLRLKGPFTFRIAEITTDKDDKPVGRIGVPELEFLSAVKGPVVYIFELDDPGRKQELVERFRLFRSPENHNRRASAKLPANVNTHQGSTLYIGSFRNNISLRIKQHLGFGNKQTYAMHLRFWAPADLKLNFYFINLQDETMTYEVEAALCASKSPLLGKVEL